MTEDKAKTWFVDHFDVSRETMEKLRVFERFLKDEAQQQNLVSAATLEQIWVRHFVDSAQLMLHAPARKGCWIDLGSGAGFPGLVIGILGWSDVLLVESRAKRIDYLHRAVERLDLQDNVRVAGSAVERVADRKCSVISARAFAPLPKLLDLAFRFSTTKTLWMLPKGRNAAKELHEAHGRWMLDMRVEPSITDAEAGILVGHVLGERPRPAPKGWQKR